MVDNPIRGMFSYRIREFLRVNPPEFSRSKVTEDPNGFIDVVFKTLAIMGLTSRVKVWLTVYKLKGVSHVLYEQWKDSMQVGEGLIECETFY